jgi:hypothetical protein
MENLMRRKESPTFSLGLSQKFRGEKKMTKAEYLAHSLKSQGGTILVVGGHIKEHLGHLSKSPLLTIWDDQGSKGIFNGRTVPSNTRGIIFNRYTSHTLVRAIRARANDLHIPIFPCLQTREMKELIIDIDVKVHEGPRGTTSEGPVHKVVRTMEEIKALPTDASPTLDMSEIESEVEEIVGIHHNEDAPAALTKDDLMTPAKKLVRGQLMEFIQKNADPSANPSKEAKRLYEIIPFSTTLSSVKQSLYKFRLSSSKDSRVTTSKSGVKVSSSEAKNEAKNEVDNFEEAIRMAKDARAALDLLIEFLPKLQKEVNKNKKVADKIRSLFS